VTLPVVWLPEADADVRAARAWYDGVRPALGEQFALAVDAAVKAIVETPLRFPIIYTGDERECGTSPMGSFSSFKSIGLW
jgi:hypothetical protein